MKNRKLILQFEGDDEAFKGNGPLAEKKWTVGQIDIFANPGISRFIVIDNNGTEIRPYVSTREPYLTITAAKEFLGQSFEKPFDIQEFEGKLQEAKDEVAKMNIFLDDAYDEVLNNIVSAKNYRPGFIPEI